MKEILPASFQASPHLTENEVNWESNDTELVFSRISNPEIAKQLNELLLEQELVKIRPFKEDDWVPHLPEGWTGEERYKLMRNTRTGAITDTEELARLRNAPYPTLESVTKETEERLHETSILTPIDFSSDSPSSDKIGLEWRLPWTNEKPTTKQWSIIEAHEKGHNLRPYEKFLNSRFLIGFDITAVNFTDDDYNVHKFDAAQRSEAFIDNHTNTSSEEFATHYLIEYLFTACEIAERMSQLKNYFGFTSNETFTKEHLDYARAHYLEDTGMDNSMRLFFEGITPKTEDNFLKLINTSGI